MILTFLLSSTVFANTLVGTTYALQAEVQSSPQSTQGPPPPRPICNPNSPALQSGSTGAKVAELQRVLT